MENPQVLQQGILAKNFFEKTEQKGSFFSNQPYVDELILYLSKRLNINQTLLDNFYPLSRTYKYKPPLNFQEKHQQVMEEVEKFILEARVDATIKLGNTSGNRYATPLLTPLQEMFLGLFCYLFLEPIELSGTKSLKPILHKRIYELYLVFLQVFETKDSCYKIFLKEAKIGRNQFRIALLWYFRTKLLKPIVYSVWRSAGYYGLQFRYFD